MPSARARLAAGGACSRGAHQAQGGARVTVHRPKVGEGGRLPPRGGSGAADGLDRAHIRLHELGLVKIVHPANGERADLVVITEANRAALP